MFLIIGIIAIICVLIFVLFLKNNFWRGAAVPLIIVGLIQCIVGFTVYNRSDKDRASNVYAFDMNLQQLKQKELPRMKAVNKNFVFYKWIEIILIMVGLFLIFRFKNNATYNDTWSGNAFWDGLGISLTIQSLLMLGADYFAAKRALIYKEQLTAFAKK